MTDNLKEFLNNEFLLYSYLNNEQVEEFYKES